MKIKTDTKLTDLKGLPIKSGEGQVLTVGEAVANILLGPQQKFGKMKAYVLATKFYNDKEVEVDDADVEALRDIIEKSEVYVSALVNGQLLKILIK